MFASIHNRFFYSSLQDLGLGGVQSSIFTDASIFWTQDPANIYHLEGAGHHYSILAASSSMSSDGQAVFALALSSGIIQVVKMPPFGQQGFRFP